MGATGYTSGDPRKVDVAGDTMTGDLVLPADPDQPLEAATKQYVDTHGGIGGGIPASILDARGDLVSASGPDTPVRLPAGSDGQLLRANSAAGTGLEWDTVTASDVGADATGTATAAVSGHAGASDPHGDRAYTDAEIADAIAGLIGAYLALTGGTLTGKLVINTTDGPGGYPIGRPGAAETGLSVLSSFDGGEDEGQPGQFDSTGRINLYSYQRADVGSYGENLRRFLMRANAKSMDAWYAARQNGAMTSGYDGSDNPDADADWVPVAWIGAHWLANDGGDPHGHWSIEVPDSTGAVQTRFEVPFTDQEVAAASRAFGVDVTNIRTNLADLTVRANLGAHGTGVLRVGGGNAVNKDILLSISSDRATSGRRWILRANTDTEAGGNAGTNFQLLRHDDSGSALGTAIGFRRSDGNAFMGTGSAQSARLALVWGTSGHHGLSLVPSSSPGTAAGVDAQMTATTDRAFQVTVVGDASRRWVLLTDGKQEWGDGTNARDTNLYRAGADLLKTDDSLVAATKLTVGQATLNSGAVLSAYVDGSAPAIYSRATADGAASSAVVHVDVSSAAKRALDIRVTGDAVSRLRIDESAGSGSGTITFGNGTSADTNLYRSAADTLQTDDTFHVTANLRLNTTSVGGGVGVFAIANAGTAPTSNPTGGGVLYVEGGILKFRGPTGVIASLLAVGTTSGTVAAGDDSRITGAQQRSTLTTKGDLYAATASATTARQPVGSDGQVLRADSGQATGMAWDTLDAADVGAAATVHTHPTTDITSGTLGVARGGTGIASYTTSNYIRASGSTTLEQRTPAQVLADIAAVGHAQADAKGDLLVATAADTFARLAVGSNGDVLTADSAETSGVKWAAPSGGSGGGYRGAWSSGTVYATGDIVTYRRASYGAVATSTAVAPAALVELFPGHTPANLALSDASAYELGMTFTVSAMRRMTRALYYKSDLQDSGTAHVLSLWDSVFGLIASAAAVSETASGIQEAPLVADLMPGRTYRLSYTKYSLGNGDAGYAITTSFGWPVTVDVLTATEGRFSTAIGTQPNNTSTSNYAIWPEWEDIDGTKWDLLGRMDPLAWGDSRAVVATVRGQS